VGHRHRTHAILSIRSRTSGCSRNDLRFLEQFHRDAQATGHEEQKTHEDLVTSWLTQTDASGSLWSMTSSTSKPRPRRSPRK
jgi:hypothetical protein